MTYTTLLREAFKSARAAFIPSLLVLLVCATVTASVLATAGRSAATAATMTRNLTQVNARTLGIIDTNSQGFITPAAVAAISTTSTTQRTLGLSTPVDAWNGRIGAGGQHVPLWQTRGDLRGVGALQRGRMPRPGEALITPKALHSLGLTQPTGYLTTTDGTQVAIVGLIDPADPYTDLADGALTPTTTTAPLREVRTVVTSIQQAQNTQQAALAILAPKQLNSIEVDSPVATAASAQNLIKQFATYGRQLVLAALAIGFLLITVVVLADVLMRRRDLGRRRTLGITRTDLIQLVLLRTMLAAATGSSLAAIITTMTIRWTWHTHIPISFTAGAAILTTLIAMLATLAPALFASLRDPVTVMRAP